MVYEVVDRQLDSVVALKTLQSADANALYRFKREFRELADVVHPNLVTLYELMAVDGLWLFTMELVDGTDFLTHVRGAPAAISDVQDHTVETIASDPDETVQLRPPARRTGSPVTGAALDRLRAATAQMAEGILALHRHRKLHRDLKPSNVRVTPAGRVVLVDFGLVQPLAADARAPAHLAGTPSYMAPEQAACEPLTEASDWYALGVMLYEALTGIRPFAGRASAELLAVKQREEPPAPSTVAPDVDPALAALCGELLRRDPAARPDGDEVLRRLRGDTPAASARRPADTAPPFVGRDAELSVLRDALAATSGDRPAVVWVHGASGMGKTALVRRFLDELEARDPTAVILEGRCYQQELVPYKGLDAVVDALSRFLSQIDRSEAEGYLPRDVASLAQLFPVLARVDAVEGTWQRARAGNDPAEARSRAVRSLRELLARIAARRPLVLAVDDVQWDDDDSGALLADLVQPPDAPAMLLVGTCRAEDRHRSFAMRRVDTELEHMGDAVHRASIDLGQLDAVDARALAAALSDGAGGEAIERIVGESGGNPLFLAELARYLRDARDADRPSAEDASLDRVVAARVARLPSGAQRLLELLAVAGRPLRSAIAMGAAQLGSAGPTALARLRAEHLIRSRAADSGELVEPYHDRIRESVAGLLHAGRRAEYHLRIARSLEAETDSDPEHLVEHWLSAGEPERASRYALAAAQRASAAFAFDRAAQFYEQALTTAAPSARPQLLRHRADALANAGRGAAAALAYLTAAHGASADAALELRRRAAEQLLRSGRIARGLVVAQSVLDAAHLSMPRTKRGALASVLWSTVKLRLRGTSFQRRAAADLPAPLRERIDACWTLAHGLAGVSPLHSTAFAARAAVLALRAGEPSRIACALSLYAAYMSAVSTRDYSDVFARTQAAAEQAGEPYPLAFVHAARGLQRYFDGDFAAAIEHGRAALDKLREHCAGAAWEVMSMEQVIGFAQAWTGAWGDICRRLPELVREAERRGDLYGAASLSMSIGWVPYTVRDDPDGGEERVAAYLARWTRDEMHFQHHYATYTTAHYRLYRGDAAGALAILDAQWRRLQAAGYLRVRMLRLQYLMLRANCLIAAAAADRAQRDALLTRAARDAKVAATLACRPARAVSAGLLANVAPGRGRDDAPDLLARAAEQLETVGMRLRAAATRRIAGQLVGGDQGATWIARCDELLRAEGVRNVPRTADTLAPAPFPAQTL